jgi:FMN phosphatase YigB (HAD superfamily)
VLDLRGFAWLETLDDHKNREDDSVWAMTPKWLAMVNEEFDVKRSTLSPSSVIEFEANLEVSVMTPIKEVQEVVKDFLAKGLRLIYISDMYLTKDTIDKILDKCGYSEMFIRGFVSSEVGLLKRTGSIFPYVENEMGAKILLHIGDNKEADYDKPSDLGISAIHWVSKTVKKNRKNLFLERTAIAKNNVSSAYFMNSKANLLGHVNGYTPEILATNLANFSVLVTKALNKSQRIGLFPAREGLLLRELVKECSKWYSLSDLHYVPFSRRNVSPLLHGGAPLQYLEIVQRDLGIVSWLDFSDLIRFNHRNALTLSRENGLYDSTVPLELNRDKEALIRIFASRAFQTHWNNVTREIEFNLRNYLTKLSGYNSIGNRYCLVDLGWNGTIQSNVEQSLDINDDIIGLYYGLNSSAFGYQYNKSKYSYLITAQSKDFTSHAAFTSPQLIEQFTLAPHKSFKSWIQIENVHTMNAWVQENPNEAIKLGLQFNSIKLINTLILLDFIYWPSEQSVAAYCRTSISKLILFADQKEVGEYASFQTEYGFSDHKYNVIVQDKTSAISKLRRSTWRYGAGTIHFGRFFAMLLLLRDQMKWGLPTPSQSFSLQELGNASQTSERDQQSVAKDEINYRRYLENFKRDDILSSSVNGKYLIKLRGFIFIANLIRFLQGKPRYRNFSIPLRTLILTRSIKNIL